MEYRGSQWASNMGFILAAAGNAVGLGDIWEFPGKVAAGGGGAFSICYALIVLFIGFPVILAELSIGCSTQKNVMGAFRRLNPRWSSTGGIGVLTLFIIMSYYSIVGGWVMKYISVHPTGTDFSAFGNSNSRFSAYFADLISRPAEPLLWGVALLLLCIYMVVRGVPEGIEWTSKFLAPGLFMLLAGIVIHAIILDGAAEDLGHMLAVNPVKFNGGAVVTVLDQAFFSLSMETDIMVTCDSCASEMESPAKSAGCICTLDSLAALLSGLAIIPVVYITTGPEIMGMGGGSVLMALPEVFSRLPGGVSFGLTLSLLLFVVVLTSIINILESCIARLTKEFGLTRLEITLLLVTSMLLLSAGYSPSQGTTDIKLPRFDFINGVQYPSMDAVTEKFTDNLIVPPGALCFCLFVGWAWGTDNISKETEASGHNMAWRHPWTFLVKFLAPAVIIVILYFTVGRGQGLPR